MKIISHMKSGTKHVVNDSWDGKRHPTVRCGSMLDVWELDTYESNTKKRACTRCLAEMRREAKELRASADEIDYYITKFKE